MKFKLVHFEEVSDETLMGRQTRSLAEIEPKVPKLVREEQREEVTTIECAQVSPAKPKTPKFSDAIYVTDAICTGDKEIWEPSVVSIF